ncbi:MAG: CvpA family protein [Erysipelotrichaceae bacterium]|nr:CvpA family protein [Erysipelotrichaceae bacterium]
MFYIIVIAIIILAQLLGLGRSLLGDITHLASAVAAFVLAILLTPAVSAAVAGLVQTALLKGLAEGAMTERILSAAIAPLIFSLVFIAGFTVIGLITHIVNNLVGHKNRSKALPKLIINLISGLLIAYAVLLPLGYYPHKTQTVSEAAAALGYEVNADDLHLERFKASQLIYRPLVNALTKIRLGDSAYSVEEIVSALGECSSFSYDTEEARLALSEQLKADPQKDALYGGVIQLYASRISHPTIRRIMEKDGRMSAKLSSLSVLTQLSSLFRSLSSTNVVTLKEMIRNADGESCAIAADVCDSDTMTALDSNILDNIPLISQFIREIGALEDRSDETVSREAEALNYVISRCGFKILSFNYNEMNVDELARHISSSTILQNSLIRVTDGGNAMDPCNVSSYVSSERAAEIISTLESKYALAADSELYKSLIAYFGVTGQ